MPDAYPLARLSIRDVSVAVVFMPGSFESAGAGERHSTYDKLQRCIEGGGFDGNLVLVWQGRGGQTRFIAPIQQHSFFQLLDYRQLYAQAVGTLSCP